MAPFGAKRHGIPIQEVQSKHSVATGITFEEHPWLIDEFTIMSAAHAANYRYFSDWQELSWQQKAKIVAFHLLNNLVESHKEDAVASALEKKSKPRK